MTHESIKKLAEEIVNMICSSDTGDPHKNEAQAIIIFQSALLKVREDTIEECAKIIETSTIPSGNVFPLLLKKAASIRALKEKT